MHLPSISFLTELWHLLDVNAGMVQCLQCFYLNDDNIIFIGILLQTYYCDEMP